MPQPKFRLGRDPLGKMTWIEVISRLHELSGTYADHVLDDDDIAPARVQVWVVSMGMAGRTEFASAKMLGYGSSVAKYLKARERGDAMTGVDAVTALRMRGFVDCEHAAFPKLDKQLRNWLGRMNSHPRSAYRFMIHRVDLARMSKRLPKICTLVEALDGAEKKVFADLLANDEVSSVLETYPIL
ncbi:hypothetical protein [Mesorhizobium sp. BR1-1-4]|uniref:hypothetical protein n=1 Tax=Mesorhizobium sp. BR1-1-4 TaxID=2876650 RepID=UPI001CCCD7CF|nr:hypothetical protein [Mesorhizobium sp. BR1-1-4]MBZ9925022.1 hypothetical protein [Mesorhizobium sp. BR1-1-4]